MGIRWFACYEEETGQPSDVANADWETSVPGLFQDLILDKMGNALA